MKSRSQNIAFLENTWIFLAQHNVSRTARCRRNSRFPQHDNTLTNISNHHQRFQRSSNVRKWRNNFFSASEKIGWLRIWIFRLIDAARRFLKTHARRHCTYLSQLGGRKHNPHVFSVYCTPRYDFVNDIFQNLRILNLLAYTFLVSVVIKQNVKIVIS